MTVAFDPDRTTVVAMYGPKPAPLAKLLTDLQGSLQGVLGKFFAPRPIADIHSTIIGMDVCSGDARARDVPGIVGHLFKEFQRAPLTVQYGGYDQRDHRMLSRGASLYERSLVVDGDKVVLIGWPVIATVGTDYTAAPLLANIRHDCEQFGVRHKYHADPTVDDPDSYMVVGKLSSDTSVDRRLVREAASQALEKPTRVLFDEYHLSVIQYIDLALPHATSDVWSLQEALRTTQP